MEDGKVLVIPDQKQCRCGNFLTAISALESSVAIAFKTTPIKLSTTHTLECLRNVTNDYKTGEMQFVWDYAKKNGGLVAESSYKPFDGLTGGECATTVQRDERSAVDFWSLLPNDEEEIKCHLAKVGPVVVGISISGTSLPIYQTGIFKDDRKACTLKNPINHDVLLIGYGTENGTAYWIVQNNWGTQWGLGGNFKMLRGQNLCKISQYPRYVFVKPPPFFSFLSPIPTPEICRNEGEIFNSNGEYLKSFCVIPFPQTYENARISCIKAGMKLFSSNTNEANILVVGNWNTLFYIEGSSLNGCKTFNSTTKTVQLKDCNILAHTICEYINVERKFYSLLIKI